jgi:hypothetical protein
LAVIQAPQPNQDLHRKTEDKQSVQLGQIVYKKHWSFYRPGDLLDIGKALGLKKDLIAQIIEVALQYSMVKSELRIDWLHNGRLLGQAVLEKGIDKSSSFKYGVKLPSKLEVKFDGESGQVFVTEVRAVIVPLQDSVSVISEDQIQPTPIDLQQYSLDLGSSPAYQEDFSLFTSGTAALNQLADAGWFFGGGKWRIEDFDVTDPLSFGAPVFSSPKILVQVDNTNAYALFGSESWGDYVFECTLGKIAIDNDEIRIWVRANGAGPEKPSDGNGYMLFLSAGGSPGTHQARERDPGLDEILYIGVSRWDNGKETILVSNLDNPLEDSACNLTADDLQQWFVSSGNGFTVGMANSPAEYFRVRAVVRGHRLTFLLSPKNPTDLKTAIDTTNIGLQSGQTLELALEDKSYRFGRVAFESISQISWFDDIKIEPPS